jgi:predicted esterase YcpF (UPF0227 family)
LYPEYEKAWHNKWLASATQGDADAQLYEQIYPANNSVLSKKQKKKNKYPLNILYIHGLSSSGSSSTAGWLRHFLPDATVYSPDLPVEPGKALNLLKETVVNNQIDIVIGTSMGGMFAQKLRGYKKILVNPAFHVSETMRCRIGMNTFLNPRQDGATEYEITEELCDAYQALEKPQFDRIDGHERNSAIGLFGTNDTTVNCMDEFQKHYYRFYTFQGGHRLREENIRENLLPAIKKLSKKINKYILK